MMRIVTMFFLMAALASAADFSGYLMDTMCAKKMKDSPAGHTAQCAKNCAGSGYGIVDKDGNYLRFDEEGNRKALAALEATDKKDNLKVKVVGERSGDQIQNIASIQFE